MKHPKYQHKPTIPEEHADFVLPTGERKSFLVYLNEKEEKGVLCDLCCTFIKLNAAVDNTRYLRGHRNKNKCKNSAQIMLRQAERAHEEEVESALHRQIFLGQSGHPSNTPPQTPKDLTPRPSFINLRQSKSLSAQSSQSEMHNRSISPLPPSSPPQSPMSTGINVETGPEFANNDDNSDVDSEGMRTQTSSPVPEENACSGQLIKWEVGSVWDTYAYQQHEISTTTWDLIGFEGTDYVRLRAHNCSIFLKTDNQDEINLRACIQCQRLANSRELARFMDRAKGNAPPHTPWRYLNNIQLTRMLISMKKKSKHLETQVWNQRKKIGTLQRKFSDHQRSIMLLSQNKIAGVSRILRVAIQGGASPKEITTRLEKAINGTYRPRGGWSQREIDVAFLIKALGGPRLLYAMQKEEAYPSLSTLRRQKVIPELLISNGTPDAPELNKNFTAFLGTTGRKPPDNNAVGQVLMIDGIALEEVCRFDQDRNRVVGLCREHSAMVKTTCDTMTDIDNISTGLNAKTLHHGKDGTVAGIAPVTGKENYYVLPLVLSGSCKADSGKELARWVDRYTELYNDHPNGKARHGPISALATDGESSFRNLRFELCTTQDLDRSLPYANILYNLAGLNMRTGKNGLLGTSDPKHIVKRFATKLRSPTGIQVDDKHFFPTDVFSALMQLPDMTEDKARLLLNPADKQNVPKAVNLLQSLNDLDPQTVSGTPAFARTLSRITFVSQVLSYFLNPFIKVEYTLSRQIFELSTYAHLLTALYRRHRTGFITSALFADSQAIVKNIIFTVARLQSIDKEIQYYILFEGTDRLEGVFSSARTQDHARNFDILQLSHKLSIGAEINAIFERYPDLNQGHLRRNLVNARGVDHINPKSWIGDVRVGQVNLEAEYHAGRKEANRLLVAQFGESWSTDWDTIFSKPDVDHLRPIEKNGYISWNDAELSVEEEDDLDLPAGSLLSHINFETCEGSDLTNFMGAREEVDVSALQDLDFIPEQLNPIAEDTIGKHYLMVNGLKQHKSAIVAARLASDRARKVTTRPLRAQGVTVEESVGRKYKIWEESKDFEGSDDLVKSGDLGGFLTRVGQSICLAVGEILNFRQGSARINLASVKFDDLDATDSREISIAVQILELVPYKDENDAQAWSWSQKYASIHDTRAETISERNFATRIPGSIFLPLGPSIVVDNNQNKTWSLRHEELQTTFEEAWEALRPETDEVIDNLELLPKVTNSTSFPYRLNSESPPLYIQNMQKVLGNDAEESQATGIQSSFEGKDRVPCKLCKREFILADMQNHVGKHILRAHRGEPDNLLEIGVEIGLNPCGWCGLDGCKTQLSISGHGTKKITSACTYHYSKMVYSAAEKSTAKRPSTNLPIHCPMCPPRLNGQPQTFWKYNLIHHMTEHHLTPSGELPPFPRDIVKITRISKLEEKALGINENLTKLYRDKYDVPDTESPLEALIEVEERESRKRAISSVSQASTSSRRASESPSKMTRRVM